MFRALSAAVAIGILALSASCTPGQPVSQAGPGVAAPAVGPDIRAVTPDKDCGGTGGVQVKPCPIRLTKQTRHGIVVTVSGPGVVNSSLAHLNSCFNGRLCYYAEREGNSQTEWRFKPGRDCVGADVQFYGEDAHGTIVGYTFLKVSNRFCP